MDYPETPPSFRNSSYWDTLPGGNPGGIMPGNPSRLPGEPIDFEGNRNKQFKRWMTTQPEWKKKKWRESSGGTLGSRVRNWKRTGKQQQSPARRAFDEHQESMYDRLRTPVPNTYNSGLEPRGNRNFASRNRRGASRSAPPSWGDHRIEQTVQRLPNRVSDWNANESSGRNQRSSAPRRIADPVRPDAGSANRNQRRRAGRNRKAGSGDGRYLSNVGRRPRPTTQNQQQSQPTGVDAILALLMDGGQPNVDDWLNVIAGWE